MGNGEEEEDSLGNVNKGIEVLANDRKRGPQYFFSRVVVVVVVAVGVVLGF